MKKVSGLLSALCVSLALAPSTALAQWRGDLGGPIDSGSEDSGRVGASDRRFYVSPMYSYMYADSERLTDDGVLGGTISVGKRITWGLNLELTAFYTELDSTADSSQTAEFIGAGLGAMLFPLKEYPNVYGIFAVHLGQADNHPTTPASTGFLYRTTVFDSGIGYLMPLFGDVLLRGEVRYRMDSHTRENAGCCADKNFYDGVANIGLLIPLGDVPSDETQEVAVVEPLAPADSDGDGVADDIDECPDTPAGTPVGSTGCEADSDGDGVVDRLDQCPDTPFGTPVDENGCPVPVDSDGDGVTDDKDQCPDTPPGTTVDENGCPEATGCREPGPGEPITLEGCATGDAIVLRGVTFDFNSARLTANARVILNQVADALIAAADLQIEVGGHTDSVGSDAYNQNLSERRAQSVHDYLVARGVPPSRMSVRGYGETVPVDTNETEEGREINRRVELRILDSGR